MGPPRPPPRAAAALLWGLLLPLTAAQEAILHASGNGTSAQSKDYCMLYYPSLTTLPSSLKNATSFSLVNLTDVSLCKPSDIPPEGIMNKAVAVQWGPCSLLEKAKIAQDGGAKALLLANNSVQLPHLGNKSEFHDLKILLAFISNRDLKDMKQTLGNNITVQMYSILWPDIDYTIVIIVLITVFTVALGGYWSGVVEWEHIQAARDTEDREKRKKKDSAALTPLTIAMFVVLCCVMIVLLYFFYKWLVYFIIVIFCMGSSVGLFHCLAALMRKIPCGRCIIEYRGKAIEVRRIFLAGLCLAVVVVWFVFRHEERWAWILQDILGIAFCLYFIKTVKITNFKSCVMLLSLLLIYDVFFVFLTPYITKNGQSVLVEVADGPVGSHEKIPILIKIPKPAFFSVMSLCSISFSLVGFGDIVVPGLLVAYCRRFDVQNGSSIYYVSSVIAYAVGMIITFVALVLMDKGQPALLYLVPCTLITAAVVAWIRKEMEKFWKGSNYQIMNNEVAEENPVTTNEQTIPH
ncbi:signal peptide peptidase-like 2A isoform X2 [Sorex araneus]|uniref:signal peptide peptidase-like 2A isoform X2 n=1 Tax=Sorex araneus TaxID=42254 RepID=UPI00243353AF|nr:signal peptide peptidase-like 2A isoform X2 [Sorex araneus]